MSDICNLESCARPSPDALICWHHTWQLQRELEEIPALLIELDTVLARQTQNGPATERVKGKGETGVYYSVLASEAYTALVDAVVGWARDYGLPWAEFATTASTHLLSVLPNSRTRGDLPKMCDEIMDACKVARNAIDAPANRTTIPVGPCPENNADGDSCEGKVVAFIPTEDDRPGRMTCSADPQHSWSSVQWYRTGRRILERQQQMKRRPA